MGMNISNISERKASCAKSCEVLFFTFIYNITLIGVMSDVPKLKPRVSS